MADSSSLQAPSISHHGASRSRHTEHSRSNVPLVTIQGPSSSSCTASSSQAPLGDSTGKRRATPDQYGRAVQKHALRPKGHTLYSGQNYQHLATFLNSRKSRRNTATATSSDFAFAILHELTPDPNEGSRITAFHEPSDLENHRRQSVSQGSNNRVIFLRGYPSPDWVKVVGAKFVIDPEVFRHHLTLGPSKDYFDLPALPTSLDHIFTLRIPSIGRCTAQTKSRAEGKRTTDRYWQSLGTNGIVGESIVRQFYRHDLEFFTIEQNITLAVKRKGSNWTVLVLLDNGRDLDTCPDGPWFQGQEQAEDVFLPVLVWEPEVCLREVPCDTAPDGEAAKRNTRQSAAILGQLPLGTNLNRTLMCDDPFYTIHELLCFCATAEKQFLNFARIQLNTEYPEMHEQERLQYCLAKFAYMKEIMRDHMDYLEQTKQFIANHQHTPWYTQGREVDGASAQARQHLLRCFDLLQKNAVSLYHQCNDLIESLRNAAAIAQTSRGYAQTKATTRITLLAFFFLPLSFATSFFGMNVRQLGQGDLDIWTFFVFAVPIFIVSLALCFWDRLTSVLGRLGRAIRFQSRFKGAWSRWKKLTQSPVTILPT